MLATWKWWQKKLFHANMIFLWEDHLIPVKVLQPILDCTTTLWLYLMAGIGINIMAYSGRSVLSTDLRKYNT
eukprot:13187269-Ditylum_brightwellii.AAC.1